MKSINFISAILVLLFNVSFLRVHATENTIKQEIIDEARKKAADEGKLLFADFYASWCTPCQWMEKNTYSNPSVSDILKQSYVRLKIDIDQPEGYTLKNVYDIKYLPTILIFNSEGKLIDRIEETLSPLKLTEVLLKHNTPVNRNIIRHDLNTAPSLIYSDEFMSESMNNMAEEYKKHFLVKQTNKMFRVQVGAYSTYQKAEQMVKMLADMTDAPVSVVSEYTDGTPVFKVRLGQFETSEEAGEYKNKLQAEHKLEGVII